SLNLPLGTLPADQIRRMANMIDEMEYHAMSQLWGDHISHDRDEQGFQNVPSASDDMLNQFLQTTMGVQQQLYMSTKGLLIDMGATMSTNGEYYALGSLNYATPANGWYAWDAAGHTREESFKAQMAANNHRLGLEGASDAVEGFVELD